MTRVASVIATFLAAVLVAAAGVLVYADKRSAETLVDGTRVAGVDVGGLTRDQALARVRAAVGSEIGRPAVVRVGQRSFILTAADAGVNIDLKAAVRRAYDVGRTGNPLTRGWRELTSATSTHDEPAAVGVDRKAIRGFVGQIHSQVSHRPVDASLDLAIERVSITPSKPGRRLAGREELVQRLATVMTRRGGERAVSAHTVAVAPKVTEDGLFDAQPVAVTVARDSRRVRVFKRGELVQTYSVAVGEPKFPTPTGRFLVQTLQRNPAWNVPNSAWAGDLAGQTIPGGDPRNPLVARWIGFDGSVGFHGTKSIDSLGRAASHGCVRMKPEDVTDLFERVQTGTPVLVA